MEQTKKILVVDDEVQMVETLKDLLSLRGYQIISAFDGQEALEKIHQEKPGLILLDMMMPKMNGLELCRILSKETEYKDIPVVLLTAVEDTAKIQQGMELGAVSYIAKPFKSETLLGVIKGILG